MRALAERGNDEYQVSVVIAPHPDTPALATATQLGLSTAVVPYLPAESYAQRILDVLGEAEYLCLAGYMKLLPPEVLLRFPGRILNIHPALLPKFGGKGMYGHHVHEAVIAAGETESGCTVHLVTEEYDEGQILLQKRCPVLPEDTPEALAARVLELEHQAFAEALKGVINASR